jgi:hypothetical protein
MGLGVDQTTGAGYINAAGNGAIQPVCLQTRGGSVGIGTTTPDTGYSTTIPNAKLSILGGTPGQANGKSRISIGADGSHYSAIEAEHIGGGGTSLSFMTCLNAATNSANPLARMTILASGNVGIGTTAPQYALQVRTNGVPGSVGSSVPATTVGSFLRNMGYLTTDRVDIEVGSSATDVGDIGCTYKYRVGMVGIGASPGANFHISGVAISGSYVGADVVSQRFTITPAGTIFFNAYSANGSLSVINNSGQVSNASDRRIKENIVYQSDTQQGLASILNLKPATFNFIGSSDSHLGFIAQDVEQDIPLAVDGKKYEWQWETTEDGKPKFDTNGNIVYKLDADGNRIVRPRGVSDRAIIATQTLAIQELAKQATSQAALVQELSKKLDAKSAALDSLIAWAQTQGYSASV